MNSITDKERIDEALELIWVLAEEGHKELSHFKLNSDDADVVSLIETLTREKLITIDEEKIQFTDIGRKTAKGIIRRQRLAERLFTDVFEIPDDTALEDACKMEHILSEELTESVCTFLGHPPTCPHGNPIPRGECCKKFKVDISPVVTRLTDFEVGATGRITFIASLDPSRISKLNSIGITAGSIIKFLQKTPSCVLHIDETTVAIDPEIAKEIYIKKTEP
jgi:DtxR family Mn-dependent transcriptional regulator